MSNYAESMKKVKATLDNKLDTRVDDNFMKKVEEERNLNSLTIKELLRKVIFLCKM